MRYREGHSYCAGAMAYLRFGGRREDGGGEGVGGGTREEAVAVDAIGDEQ